MLCKILEIMQDFGNLKKIVCTARVEEKNLEALNQWWKKISASEKSQYPPSPGENNGPSLI